MVNGTHKPNHKHHFTSPKSYYANSSATFQITLCTFGDVEANPGLNHNELKESSLSDNTDLVTQ